MALSAAADRRDTVVAVTLTMAVVVILGYASGIGVGPEGTGDEASAGIVPSGSGPPVVTAEPTGGGRRIIPPPHPGNIPSSSPAHSHPPTSPSPSTSTPPTNTSCGLGLTELPVVGPLLESLLGGPLAAVCDPLTIPGTPG